MHAKQPAVYLLASRRNGTLYAGVTSDIVGRISVHKQDLLPGFTSRYSVHLLVYFEFWDSMEFAIKREKQLKKCRRAEKIAIIERTNPEWRDLYWEVSGLVDPDAIKLNP